MFQTVTDEILHVDNAAAGQVCQDLSLIHILIELTGYKAMLEADAAKGHEDAADRLHNLGQLVNNVKNYCDQHGEEATLEGYLEDIALISDCLLYTSRCV